MHPRYSYCSPLFHAQDVSAGEIISDGWDLLGRGREKLGGDDEGEDGDERGLNLFRDFRLELDGEGRFRLFRDFLKEKLGLGDDTNIEETRAYQALDELARKIAIDGFGGDGPPLSVPVGIGPEVLEANRWFDNYFDDILKETDDITRDFIKARSKFPLGDSEMQKEVRKTFTSRQGLVSSGLPFLELVNCTDMGSGTVLTEEEARAATSEALWDELHRNYAPLRIDDKYYFYLTAYSCEDFIIDGVSDGPNSAVLLGYEAAPVSTQSPSIPSLTLPLLRFHHWAYYETTSQLLVEKAEEWGIRMELDPNIVVQVRDGDEATDGPSPLKNWPGHDQGFFEIESPRIGFSARGWVYKPSFLLCVFVPPNWYWVRETEEGKLQTTMAVLQTFDLCPGLPVVFGTFRMYATEDSPLANTITDREEGVGMLWTIHDRFELSQMPHYVTPPVEPRQCGLLKTTLGFEEC
uniref:Uncharacterized protein n=1 Tax=Chromera velia CCMP2878 TaxID=1169474 RepID=A0A0G4GDI2_9ALVE|eukprot:Cvel_4551.t1-p1 / transcript=Cvel_4551.t1 / gene=Cvel_4551 / organism=Chromera_velia_CCMP2878 / gene_product=hypothetical protein / transcript_product=hypothetical protein / location=Cvel_scaffold199:99681-102224(-) / protein_length=463 / sequence_SO=supercontig / SO=protein_coding / is_pseudo=false